MPILTQEGVLVGRSTLGADIHVRWLEEYFAGHGVRIPPTSRLRMSLDALRRHGRMVRGEEEPLLGQAGVALNREATGIDYFIRSVARCSQQLGPSVQANAYHLSRADLNFLRLGDCEKGRNIGWELLVASWVASFASHVSMGRADVHCKIGNEEWAIECKQLYSENPSKQVRRIVEGAKQLETERSGIGLVVVGLTNLIPHDRFFRLDQQDVTKVFALSIEEAQGQLSSWIDQFQGALPLDELRRRMTETKDGAPRVWPRACVFVAQSVAFVGPRLAVITIFRVLPVRTCDLNERRFIERMARAAVDAATFYIDG